MVATRSDVLRSLATGGRSLLGQPTLILMPALCVAMVALASLGCLAWAGWPHLGETTLLVSGLVASALGLVGVFEVAGLVRREWDGSTMSLLWPTGLVSAEAAEGWARVWMVPGALGALVGSPGLVALGLVDGLSFPFAFLAGIIPILSAPLAGYMGLWCAAGGPRAEALRSLVAAAVVIALPGGVAYGLWLWLSNPFDGPVICTTAQFLLVAAALLAREVSLQELAHRPGQAGFTPGD